MTDLAPGTDPDPESLEPPIGPADVDAHADGARRTRVFLSYRRPDQKSMNRVRTALQDHGYQVWWDTDRDSIPAGTFWPSSIEQGIAECDAFVVLVSPHALRSPKQLQRELYLADQAGKRMVALMVRPVEAWPDGFGYFLGGLERIGLHGGFATAMAELVAFLGPTWQQESDAAGIRARLGRGRDRLRRFARDHDLGTKAKTHGITVLATAGTLAAAVIAAQARHDAQARQRYIEETSELLAKSLREIRFAQGMNPREYRTDFQPRFQRLMGQLERATPPQSLAPRHQRLVRDLDALGEEFDELARLAESGQLDGLALRVDKLNHAWSDVLGSNLAWLRSALGVPE